MSIAYRDQFVQSKRPSKTRPQLYGYALTDQWIEEFAANKRITSSDGHISKTTPNVLLHILRESGFRPYVIQKDEGTALCIAVGHNRTPEGLKFITRERINKIKRVMGVEEVPSWYYPE